MSYKTYLKLKQVFLFHLKPPKNRQTRYKSLISVLGSSVVVVTAVDSPSCGSTRCWPCAILNLTWWRGEVFFPFHYEKNLLKWSLVIPQDSWGEEGVSYNVIDHPIISAPPYLQWPPLIAVLVKLRMRKKEGVVTWKKWRGEWDTILTKISTLYESERDKCTAVGGRRWTFIYLQMKLPHILV